MKPLRTASDYASALAEFDDLCLADPGTPESLRFAELVDLIDAYTLSHEYAGAVSWLTWLRTRQPADATAASR